MTTFDAKPFCHCLNALPVDTSIRVFADGVNEVRRQRSTRGSFASRVPALTRRRSKEGMPWDDGRRDSLRTSGADRRSQAGSALAAMSPCGQNS